VAAGELSRPPRAPGLNGDLERNYPAEARRSGVGGTAVIRISILPDGRVGSIRRVSESYPGFGEACERTVRGSRWSPPLDARGEPVATEVNYTCRFEIKG
jgi:TonB family protein